MLCFWRQQFFFIFRWLLLRQNMLPWNRRWPPGNPHYSKFYFSNRNIVGVYVHVYMYVYMYICDNAYHASTFSASLFFLFDWEGQTAPGYVISFFFWVVFKWLMCVTVWLSRVTSKSRVGSHADCDCVTLPCDFQVTRGQSRWLISVTVWPLRVTFKSRVGSHADSCVWPRDPPVWLSSHAWAVTLT